MGFGAIIASGDDNTLLSDCLADGLTEVRVEQYLDRPTRFALRFQEDMNDVGDPMITDADELAPERMITVAVQEGLGTKCLVRGPITETKSSIAFGGPGSWFEAHGVDRRVEMGRVCQRKAWIGTASSAALVILGSYGFIPNVQATTRVYQDLASTLNQRATDLDFMNLIARQNNLSFWMSYECQINPLDPFGGTLAVIETANVTSSPPRPDGAPGLPPPPPLPLIPSVGVSLRVNPPTETDQTVMGLEINCRVEQPTSFEGQAVDDRLGKLDRTAAEDRQPSIVANGQTLRDIAPAERKLCVTTAGDQIELQNRSEAALTDAGWMFNATAKTTAHMLGGVLSPHDVVEMEYVGVRHSGPWQVAKVAHTINAADHHMEVELRRNSIGDPNALPLP